MTDENIYRKAGRRYIPAIEYAKKAYLACNFSVFELGEEVTEDLY